MTNLSSIAQQRFHLERARKNILDQRAADGVFQFRFYVYCTIAGALDIRYRTLRTAVEQLNNERRLYIMSRRPFGKTFDDGSSVDGVNITAIPIQRGTNHE